MLPLCQGSQLEYFAGKEFYPHQERHCFYVFADIRFLQGEKRLCERRLSVISSLFNDLKITKSTRFFINSFTELLQEHCIQCLMYI